MNQVVAKIAPFNPNYRQSRNQRKWMQSNKFCLGFRCWQRPSCTCATTAVPIAAALRSMLNTLPPTLPR
jgi:hypothetical protein